MTSQHIEMNIREAEANDLDSIITLIKEFNFIKENESYEDVYKAMMETLKLCNIDKSHTVLISEEIAGDFLGFIVIHWLPYLIFRRPEGYVSELFITSSARGKGVGTRLLEKARKEARKRGCFRLNVLNRKDRSSYHRKFYKKDGWTEREEIANFVFKLN